MDAKKKLDASGILNEVDALGIMAIEPTGNFSKDLIREAVSTAKEILNDPELDKIASGLNGERTP